MTDADMLQDALSRTPVVGIIRGCPSAHVVSIGAAAADAGILTLEITLDSPDPIDSIRELAAALPHAVVGAGTVRTVNDVERVVAAGARFVVSPISSVLMIEAAAAHGVPVLPGAATPTEIWAALEAGAFAVKVFPARELGGPGYLGAIRGPLGSPPLIPTGGVGVANASDYMGAGALAVGVGGSVFSREALASADTAWVGSAAIELVRSLK